MIDVPTIIDANLNRVSEGLRVIEDYCRFVASHKPHATRLATFRYQIAETESSKSRTQHLLSRDIASDQRAMDPPKTRPDLSDLLTANFKRVTEGLRVLEEYTGDATFNQVRYHMYDLEKEICLGLLKPKIVPGIYLISDDVAVLEQGLKWGVSLIQLRAKNQSKSDIYQLAKHMAPIAKQYNTPFIVNDYIDIAYAVDAEGIHTGQDDIPLNQQRHLLGPHKLIGRTTHSLEQGKAAKTEGADYISVGPIWDTPSKPNRPGIGFDYLKNAKSLDIPYVAIGGISIKNIEKVTPFSPPMVGVIRDYPNIPALKSFLLKSHTKPVRRHD